MSSSNKNKITIVGGGVNGICSAYYLSKEGFEVEVVDPSFSIAGTSYGNAGMVVPSHFIPMASPGIISKGLAMMLDSSSPFYIKPRLDFRLAQWLWRFTRSCTSENVQKTQHLIWKYNEMSKEAYREIATEEEFNFDFKEEGLLMLYRKEKSQKEENEVAESAEKLGVKIEILDRDGVQKLNPDCEVDVLGGVYYPDDAHLYSNRFMDKMIALLKARNVKFISDKVVDASVINGKVVSLKLAGCGQLNVESLVITAGSWSWKIAKMLGMKLLLEDGKGYSITQENVERKPTIPSILTDEKVAITPMDRDLRITGTLEISGLTTTVNQKRVKGFLSAVPKYFPDVNVASAMQNEIWTGYRPLSFDGVPYVGRSSKVKNVIVATGHGMMGMSLGPGTGKLVANIASEKNSILDMDLMRIER
jgi:D-amino-acid dehydrogenase